MGVRFVESTSGQPVEDAVRERLKSILEKAMTAERMRQGLLDATKEHVKSRFPGSRHWDPEKITPGKAQGQEAEINVNIAGAGRAYHDVEIRPKYRKALAIPMHRDAFGLKPADFPNAFMVKKKDGGAFLAENRGGRLAFLFALVKKAFQPRDPSVMPSDSALTAGVLKAFFPEEAR